MVEEARRIFAKYLENGEMYCDPRFVEEVRSALKGSGKGVTGSLFRKCGAFIYHRSEHSWGRQARATIVWTNKSYDNHSAKARAVEEEFDLSVLPEGVDLQIVPTIDDCLQNNELLRDYGAFLGQDVYTNFMAYRAASMEYFKAPQDQKKPLMEKIGKHFGDQAELFPKLKPIHEFYMKEVKEREVLADSVFAFLTFSMIQTIAKKTYSDWLIQRAVAWKTIPWTPVVNITFSDLTTVYGMSTVERKIEEAALKGKSGLARLIAKRHVKKQTVVNIRTNQGQQVTELSKTVFSTEATSDMLDFAAVKDKPLFEVEGVTSGTGSDSAHAAAKGEIVVPTIQETLSSTYLRSLFEGLTLHAALEANELELWNALTHFFVKYSNTEDEKMDACQSEMKKEIEQICEKYSSLLSNSKDIKQRAKKQKAVFPQFFRSYEIELFGKHYPSFEKALHEKGWK